MTPLCENSFTITKTLFFQGMSLLSRQGYGKAAMKYSLILLAAWAALSMFLLYTGNSIGQVLFYLVLVGAICLWMNVWAPRSNAKRAWKAMMGRSGDGMLRRTLFFQDHLEISGDCEDKSVNYGEILEIQESRDLVVLTTVNKLGIMLAKDGFVTGDLEKVRQLVRGG